MWEFKEIMLMNKGILTKEEINFLGDLYKKVEKRFSKFPYNGKKISLKILDKVDEELLSKLSRINNKNLYKLPYSQKIIENAKKEKNRCRERKN